MAAKFKFTHDTTAFNLQNAHSLALAAQLAYQDKPKIKERVQKEWDFEHFYFMDANGTQGFIMSNDQIIVVSFRGTSDIEDWLTNLDFDLIEGPLDGKVHEGFYTALSSVWRQVERTIAKFRDNKAKSLWFTGHSMGAALATLSVARFRENDRPVDGLYTFGQPRTGDRTFARMFNFDFKPFAFRFVNNNDIVTRIPPRSRKYSHIGTFKYFTESGDLVDDIGWWNRFLDIMRGRIEDILEWGTDGVKDHDMKEYVRLVKQALNKSR